MGSRPTLRSVAEAAGVSTATVSYAFNRPDRLSVKAREHILAVARSLGYAGPDPAARSLRTGRAGAIGVIFKVGLTYAFTDPYITALLTGMADELEESLTSLVLVPFAPVREGQSDDEVRRSMDAVHQAVIDGAVADGFEDGHPAIQVLAGRNIPLVRSTATEHGLYVRIDDVQAGRLVGTHLRDLGHRDVTVVIAGDYPYSRTRLDAIREVLPDVSVVTAGGNTVELGRLAAQRVPRGSTAVAADSDVLAVGLLDGLGGTVAVTGFDDIPLAGQRGLTTVRQPIHEKGRLMARILLDPHQDRQVTLPTELVVRASTERKPS